ncbi:MAG: site-specific DNA-methyltransferase [Sedimentisphaerales bacterium]|nr:site-specific DNA-methyltransferase [Sedimentisphaerales bacterium]
MESRTIKLTSAAHKYGNVNLHSCGKDFFPPDVFGSPSKKTGLGKPIVLELDGFPDPIETDIPLDLKTRKPRWIFRARKWIKDFVQLHKLAPNDLVTIHRLSTRRYKVSANNHNAKPIDYLNKVFFRSAQNMAELPNESVHMIVTSPPYFNVKDYSLDGWQRKKTGTNIKGQIGDIDDYEKYLKELTIVWKECYRVLKPNGKLCVNVPLMPILKSEMNTHHTRDIFDINAGIQHEILHNTKFFLFDIFIWDRTNPTKKLMFGSYPYPPNFYAQNTVEFITVYVKDGSPERKSIKIKEESKLTEQEWVEYTKQVWQIPVPNRSDVAYGKHPAIMPEDIAKRLMRLFSFVEDTVLDPFMGSGTTAKVALELGRNYVGYEIDKKYKRLIDLKTSQTTLFAI